MGGEAVKIIVYHGGIKVVDSPVCRLGRKNLDFGQGFYVTDIKEQAVKWAELTSQKRQAKAIVNRYILNKSLLLEQAKYKIFTAYDIEWLDFIVASRKGLNPAAEYDYIEGGVANDRVIDTVNLYMSSLMSAEVALQRLAMHQPNNQICLLNQSLTDKFLQYDGTESIG